jgi:predicted secreted protein
MTSNAAYGTLLQQGDGGTPTESFTTVAQVSNISGPGLSMDALDVTHHSSTAGWREFIGGLMDGGEVTVDIFYDPVAGTHDGSTGLIKDMEDRTVRNFQLVFPDAGTTTWSFAALVTGFEPSAPIDGSLTASVTLKLSGQPTLA